MQTQFRMSKMTCGSQDQNTHVWVKAKDAGETVIREALCMVIRNIQHDEGSPLCCGLKSYHSATEKPCLLYEYEHLRFWSPLLCFSLSPLPGMCTVS